MTTTINASTINGFVTTADTSGQLAIQANGTTVATAQSTGLNIASTGLVFSDSTTQTSGSGVAKAWVNFNGSSPTVRASYNVSSVTRASAGQYTVNFTNAFSDTNYAVVANAASTQSSTYVVIGVYTPSNSSYSNKTTSACAINAYSPAVGNYDPYECDIAFFR